jgi:hypothetical protein
VPEADEADLGLVEPDLVVDVLAVADEVDDLGLDRAAVGLADGAGEDPRPRGRHVEGSGGHHSGCRRRRRRRATS